MSRRNEAFAIIRKNGMYKHNVEMMKSAECELLREREQGKPKDLVVCGTCHGCYDRANIWHHKRHCHPSEDTVSPPYIPVSLMCTSAAVSDHFKVDILDHFVNDDVGRLCKTDPTILLAGQCLHAKVKQKPDKKSGVKDDKPGQIKHELIQYSVRTINNSQVSRKTYPRKMHALYEKRVYISRIQLFLAPTDRLRDKPPTER